MLIIISVLGVLAFGAVRATTSEATTQVVTKHELVDGKSVKWWAHRARTNGTAMRWQQRRVSKLQSLIRQKVSLGSDGLASAFICIHGHEGSWDANTGNGYYGGLQMDRTFQATYGGEFYSTLGTANNWPDYIQVAVAMRAYYSGRGFGPWPNTRRMCGI